MSISVTLLTILSGVCLLLWGLRTIKRAVLRGFGAQVQSTIASSTRNRFTAFFSGALVTMVMQSSVATIIMTSSFFGRGLMTLPMGLAIVIGADVGSSILAQILSLDLSWLAPFLLSFGIIFHLMHDNGSPKRFLARIIMGLGFVLTGLAIIKGATAPLSDSHVLPLMLQPLEAEPLLALLIATLLTYLMHSGLSAVLLFAALASTGVLSLPLAMTFIIGVNFGIAIIPMVAVMRDTPAAVQIPLANIIMRLVVGVIALIIIPMEIEFFKQLDLSIVQSVIATHIAFNVILGLIFLPLIGPLAKLSERISPVKEEDAETALNPKYLDKKALSSPSSALSCATRETLHMSEILEDMLAKSYDALANNDRATIDEVRNLDEHLDTIHSATKNYIIHLTREELSDKESNQALNIMNFATNLEHCGDVIDSSLMDIAKKKTKAQGSFSDDGLAEIKSIHKKVAKNLKLAQSIFLSSDPILAKQLLDYKKGLKAAESASAENHMKRLREGLPATMATSGMHMDVIRDLRRINTYVTSVAYGVLGK